MQVEVDILIVEDDDGHAALIERNLKRAGLTNRIQRFSNGQAALDFMFCRGDGPHREHHRGYMMLLDIRMPGIDGVEVLRQIKADEELCKMPVIMLTTTDAPCEIERCHKIGCNSYVTKPLNPKDFMEAIRQLGLYFSVVQVPKVNGEHIED